MFVRLVSRNAPRFARGKATASQPVEGQAESTKRVATGIFSSGMLPLVLLTIAVGYVGYNFRKGAVYGPEQSTLAKQGKSMEDLKMSSGSDREVVQKTIQAVNKDRDKKDELVWSKGTLEKNSYEASPDESPNKKPSAIRS